MASANKRGKWWRGSYKDDKGVWQPVSVDDNGLRFKTKSAARAYARTLEEDAKAGRYISPAKGRLTIREWSELWLDSIDVGNLSDRDYRSRLKAVILPRWGDIAVADVSVVDFRTWEKQLKAERAHNSVTGIVSTFRTMLDDAVKSKLRIDNPIPTNKAKRRGKYTPTPKDEKILATPRQALLAAQNALIVRGFSLYVQILTHAYCGPRIAEAAAIKREQPYLVDTGQGSRILIDQQTQYVDGKPACVMPKYGSDRGPAGIIVPPFLAVLLRMQAASHSGDFMFTAPKGGRLLIGGDFYADSWHPCTSGRAPIPSSRGHKARPGIRPVAGIEGIVPHGFRHSMKMWLDEAGCARVAVEERMGHTIPGVEGTYSHTSLAMELQIAAVLQELWEQSHEEPGGEWEYGPIPEPAPPVEPPVP